MGYTVSVESFDSLSSCWLDSGHGLRWDCVFVLPNWLQTWWQVFGEDSSLCLCSVEQGNTVIGIAPLLVRGEVAYFIGDGDVCDCLDFVVAPGVEYDFFEILLDHLGQQGVTSLNLGCLRPDSAVLTHLLGVARRRGCEVLCSQEDVSFELDLPSTWDEYMRMLSTKQRHEMERRLRRLTEEGDINYRIAEGVGAVNDTMDTFLRLLRTSRDDKAEFMTDRMESFFRLLAESMAQMGLLKLCVLELNTLPGAAVMCFDYNGTVYLYNSGYDRRLSSLSVGLLSKALSIKDSIERGRNRYDFLRGAEEYKRRLGGREVPLYRCQIDLRG